MAKRVFFYFLLSLLVIVVDSTLVKFMAIANVVPDILIIWVAYIAIREGQIAGVTAGFFLGLTIDLLGKPDGMVGLDALSKTFAGFAAGYFYNENKIENNLGGYQFVIITGVASLVHNSIYFAIFLQGSGLNLGQMFLYHGLPATAYTVAVAFLPMFMFARKYMN